MSGDAHGRTTTVDGTPFDPITVTTAESNTQPFANEEALAEAVYIVEAQLHEIVTRGIPPFIIRDLPDERS